MKPSPKKPSALIESRLRTCRRLMARRKIAALLVTNRFDHYHLTGFTGEDSAVLVTPRLVHVISDGRFDTAIRQEVPWAQVSLRKGQLLDEIATVVQRYRLRQLAVQANHMTVADRSALGPKLRRVRLVDAPSLIGEMRLLKDKSELALMNRAVRIAEDAFRATLQTIRVGQTELELAARLEYEMKRRGSSTPAFDSIVAIDANAALPHAFPGQRKVKKGCTILFDWGATYRFYRSDLTRTVFVGSIPPRLGQAYELVLEAQQRAIAAIRPGARMCDVDAVARRCIADAGYEKEFNHGLGHGLGLDVHEAPSLSWRSSEKLRAGMVVTVEPGVYLPGIGGVRIEDDVLVTPAGGRLLSRLNKSLRSALLAAPA
jgi:Xaa-Pro aminopeptidase